VLQLSTPLTRLAVMEGRTLAIAAFNTKLDDDFEIASTDPVERAAIRRQMDETAGRIEADMDPMAAAARMDTDEVVPFAALRPYLEAAVEMAWQTPRRARNPRIWSLHDLAVLTRAVASGVAEAEAAAAATVEAPVDGLVAVRVATDGTFWRRPSPRDPVFLEEGARVEPSTAVGLIEVMKTFAPVRAGLAGRVERFALTDGTPVAAGTIVAWVRPE
jgi:biotin carboxyl carrier protein